MGKEIANTELAAWLKGQLDERGWGVRTLARQMNSGEPEVARRLLNRVLYQGSSPSDQNRSLIAAGLDVPVSEVPAPDPFRREAA